MHGSLQVAVVLDVADVTVRLAHAHVECKRLLVLRLGPILMNTVEPVDPPLVLPRSL
jgi:hypothetical protein